MLTEVLSLLFRYNRFKNCKLPYINHKFPTYLCKPPPPPPGTVQYYKLPPSPSPSPSPSPYPYRYKPSSLYIVACVEASVKTSQRKSYSGQHCYKKPVLLTFFFSSYCKPPWIKARHLQCISPRRKPRAKMYKLRAQGRSQLFD